MPALSCWPCLLYPCTLVGRGHVIERITFEKSREGRPWYHGLSDLCCHWFGGWDQIRHGLKRLHSALLHVDVWSHLSGSSAISGTGYKFSPLNLFYLMPGNDSYFWCWVSCNWPQVPCLSLSFPFQGVSYVLCPLVVNLGGPLDAYTPLSSYPRYCFPFLLQKPLKKNGSKNIVVI